MADQDTYKRSIEDFRHALQGGGVRPTMFQVELTFPPAVVEDQKDIEEDGVFLIKAAQLPGSIIGEIPVPFRGRKLKVAGDRSFENWSVTVTNDVTFRLRKAFEEWSEFIQNHNYALGTTTLDSFYASAIVRQLDRDASQLRSYRFEGIWPLSVGSIGLDFDTNDTVEEYDVEFAVQYWSAIEVGDPQTSNTAVDSTQDKNKINS